MKKGDLNEVALFYFINNIIHHITLLYLKNVYLCILQKAYIAMRKIITLTIFFFCLCLSYLYVNTDSRLSKKIWLHRANNVNKAKYFQEKYAGIEIDITFVDSLKTFLVQLNFLLSEIKLVLGTWEEVENLASGDVPKK